MKLLDHLKETDERVEDFASRIGEARSTIRKIVYGQRQPSLPLAVKIERATKGAVTPADMLLEAVLAVCPECHARAEHPAVRTCRSPGCPMAQQVAA